MAVYNTTWLALRSYPLYLWHAWSW